MGDLWSAGEPDWTQAASVPNVKLHLYGKLQARPGRKMGHLTALSGCVEQAQQDVQEALSRLVVIH
jgi:5-(carboxyamino)imidazole ribonucleotide synthase